MYRRLGLAWLALLVIGLGTAQAQSKRQTGGGAEWRVLATIEVDLGKGTEAIDLSRSAGAVRAIRVREASGSSNVRLTGISIDYTPPAKPWRETREIELRPGGAGTNPIDSGVARFLTTMTLSYVPQAGRTARFEVLGLQSAADLRATRPDGAAPAAATDAAAVATSAAPGAAMPNGAIYFGHQYVNFVRDRDAIRVPAQIGQFDRLKLRVLDNDIFIDEMRVVYADGQTVRLPVAADVRRNSETPWLKLTGGDRFIDRVDFAYRSKPGAKGQARVELYGELSERWLGKDGLAAKFNEGWVLIGAQTAGRFLRPQTDVIAVSRNDGNFKRLRIVVKERDLVLTEIRVVHDNNEEAVFAPRARVAVDGSYGPVDLKSGRPIRSIRATYRSVILDAKAIGKGGSVVEIWGQR